MCPGKSEEDAYEEARRHLSTGSGSDLANETRTESTRAEMDRYRERISSQQHPHTPTSSKPDRPSCNGASSTYPTFPPPTERPPPLKPEQRNYTHPRQVSPANNHADTDLPTPLINLPKCMQANVSLLQQDTHNHDVRELLRDAPIVPPVTTSTLKELELQYIQNNINLRIDVNYDHDLHFMPISGRRGEEKRVEAKKYWMSLEVEFGIYQHNLKIPCMACAGLMHLSDFYFRQRLPTLFDELKALLLILVPDHDHGRVSETLDVPLLIQEVSNGALDVLKLSAWLSDLLTSHCAPIRDEWAQDMAAKISEGAQQNDMTSLVAGLEKLFSFCEAMKLDVANHQIRTFRLPLIEDGVSFQRDYFQTRIRLGKLHPGPSLVWFRSVFEVCLETRAVLSEYSPIVHGLIRLATHASDDVPELLKYDCNRIQQVREEISDLVHLDICWDVFALRVGGRWDLSWRQIFNTRLLDLTDGDSTYDAGSDAIWNSHLDAIAMEIARATSIALKPPHRTVAAEGFALVRKEVERQFHSELETRLDSLAADLQRKVTEYVDVFHRLSALQISEFQLNHQQLRQNKMQGRQVPDIEDIARRLAHIAIIHWRVWRDLYLPMMEGTRTGVSGADSVWPPQGKSAAVQDNGQSDTHVEFS